MGKWVGHSVAAVVVAVVLGALDPVGALSNQYHKPVTARATIVAKTSLIGVYSGLRPLNCPLGFPRVSSVVGGSPVKRLFASKRLLAASLLGALGLSSALPVFAQTFERDTAQRVVVRGLTAYGAYEVTYDDLPKTRPVQANACGFYALKGTTTYPLGPTVVINGSASTIANLTVVPTPTCTNGAVVNNPGNGIYRDSNNTVFIMGQAAYGQISVTYPNLPTKRAPKADACGRISLNNSTGVYTGYTGSLTVTGPGAAGVQSTVGNLTPGPASLCRQGVTYVPLGSNP